MDESLWSFHWCMCRMHGSSFAFKKAGPNPGKSHSLFYFTISINDFVTSSEDENGSSFLFDFKAKFRIAWLKG